MNTPDTPKMMSELIQTIKGNGPRGTNGLMH